MLPSPGPLESTASTRKISILGSTGSIGTQTLDIVRLFPDRISVKALTAGRNHELLIRQAREFRPDVVVIADAERHGRVKEGLSGTGIRVLAGSEALLHAATLPDVETVVAALVGFAGLAPTLAAMRAGKRIALANKESLVVAGELVQRAARKHDTAIIPVDSEHSAIFQCLAGETHASVEGLLLTASGGPFRTWSSDRFESISRAQALNHPNWSMGSKITIDSATMMNKGLEVIEAHWMFDIEPNRIDVVVHPQSIIHSMVTFIDGSVKAQLGVPDMKVPIQYALSYPERWKADHERADFYSVGTLDFESPDLKRFPCLALAYEALRQGGTAPAVLNAANEVAVDLFLKEKIGFLDIPRLIEQCLPMADTGVSGLAELQDVDSRARTRVMELSGTAAH